MAITATIIPIMVTEIEVIAMQATTKVTNMKITIIMTAKAQEAPNVNGKKIKHL